MAMVGFMVLGVILGVVVTLLIIRAISGTGMLKVDIYNPEKDIYRLEIDNLDELREVTQVILKVKKVHLDRDSQE